MPNQLLKVGDMIVDFDQIHVVFKIEDDLVFYRPLVKKDEINGNVTSSIPLNNFKKAGIRLLSSKSEIKKYLLALKQEKPLDIITHNNKNNNNNLKEYLYLNDPITTGQLLIYLNNRQKTPVYSKADQIIFDQAIDHISHEIAVVSDISIDEAKKLLISAIHRDN